MRRNISILLILFLTNCATILHGTRQKINFVSSPPGASVSINNVNKGETPLLLKLKRKDDHLVQMNLPGYQLFQTTLTQKFDGLIFMNLVFGGLFGAIIDVVDGATYKLVPEKDISIQNATYEKDETKKGSKVLSVVLVTSPSENKSAQITPEHIVEIKTDNAYMATINKPIKFRQNKKETTKDITIELDKKFKWDELTLIGVNDISIPEAVKAKYKVQSKKLQAFVFGGWDVVRFLPIGSGQNEFKLNFRAESGGNSFSAVAVVAIDLKAK